MVRRTHWYLLLLLGTVMGIVSCSTQSTPMLEVTGTGATIPTAAAAPVRQEVTIEVKTRANDMTLTDVTVRSADGTEKQFHGLVDVFREHYKAVQYAGDALYVVHRTGGGSGYATNPMWTDSLWVHPTGGSGTRLAEGRGLDARISDDGRFVAVATEKEVFILRDGKALVTKAIESLMPTNKELLIVAPAAVGAGYSWFESTRAASLVELVRLDNATGAIEHIQVEKDAVSSSYLRAVEPQKGRVIFWDRPFAFDVETAAELDKKESHLMVFDPATHKTQQLMTFEPGRRLEAVQWQDAEKALYKLEGGTRFETLEAK